MTTLSEPVRAAGGSQVTEVRTRPLDETDARIVRAADEEAAPRFVGHAAVFDSRTAIGNPLRWGWYEEIARGAFDKTLAEGDARFLVDHDTRMLVGRVTAGDLRLSTDDIGLAVDADLDQEVSYVRDFARNLEKRRITGMSFGFIVVRDEWSSIDVEVTGPDGKTETHAAELRRIIEVKLLEVSGVTFPAYEDTDAGLRAMVDEVRVARGRTTDSPATGGDRPAPADATRDTSTEPAPADATRVLAMQDERAKALNARYPSLGR
ncbi:HK97 family phage prohead protease [Pseudactinotalea suaedae]|uniref:HK97 family phage prohead protease n=1 Tax=Pseudactinotalea suaedae TaxID=1524924 RepID=UPI0012E1ACD9|nr:HK97 family phage prohead protease [Pseudactinotalea suaedae]